MPGISDLLPEASAILALASAAGMGLQWGALRSLRAVRDDQAKQITLLENHRARDKAEISQLKSDLDSLARVVTGEVHWKALSDTLDDHHASVSAKLEVLEAVTNRSRGLLDEILDEVRRRSP